MIEGLHAAIIALLGVIGGLVQALRNDIKQLETLRNDIKRLEKKLIHKSGDE